MSRKKNSKKHTANNRFCHNCGKKLDNSPKFCPNCGAEIRPGSLSNDDVGDLDIDKLEQEMQRERDIVDKYYRKRDYIFGSVYSVVAIAMLYVTGWSVLWKGFVYPYSHSSVVFKCPYYAIRFNNDYYGLELTKRFFDSPIISGVCFCVSLGLIVLAIRHFLHDVYED